MITGKLKLRLDLRNSRSAGDQEFLSELRAAFFSQLSSCSGFTLTSDDGKLAIGFIIEGLENGYGNDEFGEVESIDVVMQPNQRGLAVKP